MNMEWTLLLICLLSHLLGSVGKREICNTEFIVDTTSDVEYSISSPDYPDGSYEPGVPYTWCISTLGNTSLSLFCKQLDIPKSTDCETNALTVTYDGDTSSFCGSNTVRVRSKSGVMKIKLHSSRKVRGGKFFCEVQTEQSNQLQNRAIVYSDCDCGYSYRPRIVGGRETGINEFPFMAGLLDARRGAIIVCGATIISQRYVMTVDHCLGGLVVDQTAVVVGEHNISTGADTSATRVIRAKRFIHYPYYDSNTQQYDIALIELVSTVTYNMRVGPVCLPFMSRNWDLTGEAVTVLGWGTTEFGGPRSKVLKKTNLDLVNIQRCVDTYGSKIEPYTQLCTYTANTDACQYDSGGPLVWFNYYTNRYEIAGLISYGRGCAQRNTPSINTKVSPFLQWILDNTLSETYCHKSES